MDQKTLDNKAIGLFLTQPENFETLEKVLDDLSKEHLRLKRLSPSLNFGPIVDERLLFDIVPSVARETDHFLGVRGIPHFNIMHANMSPDNFRDFYKRSLMPFGILYANAFMDDKLPSYAAIAFLINSALNLLGKYVYESSAHMYHSEQNLVRLLRLETQRTQIIGPAAHEYAHHVESYAKIPDWLSTDTMCEGFATGTERAIAGKFAEKEDNPAFVVDTTEQTAGWVYAAYSILCHKKLRKPKKSFGERLELSQKDAVRTWYHDRQYVWGASLFFVLEEKFGARVYREFLKAKKVFRQI